ncbi:MAG: hypothetical protein U0166_05260 [Acidobacteriota bacterium]
MNVFMTRAYYVSAIIAIQSSTPSTHRTAARHVSLVDERDGVSRTLLSALKADLAKLKGAPVVVNFDGHAADLCPLPLRLRRECVEVERRGAHGGERRDGTPEAEAAAGDEEARRHQGAHDAVNELDQGDGRRVATDRVDESPDERAIGARGKATPGLREPSLVALGQEREEHLYLISVLDVPDEARRIAP